MKIAVVGLGKMGHQIAVKLQQAGHQVHGVVLTPEQAVELQTEGFSASVNRQDARAFFGTETAVIWLMIPAEGVDTELDAWLDLLQPGSIVIDGGNSDFRLTRQRSVRANAKSIQLVDIGTSGGIHGLTNGFSMMVGGPSEASQTLAPILDTLAKPHGAYQYFGESGSGHYVKMVHNAIEYGTMQSYAEGYRMLQEGAYAGTIDLAAAGEVWQHGSVIASWLNELTQSVVAENPSLEGIEGFVADSGEARWTLEVARDQNISLPAIQAAYNVRIKSQQGETNFATKLLAAMRNKFGGHAINKS